MSVPTMRGLCCVETSPAAKGTSTCVDTEKNVDMNVKTYNALRFGLNEMPICENPVHNINRTI